MNGIDHDRLTAEALFLRPAAEWLMDRIGIESGWRSLDLACGPIGVIDVLAARSGAAHVTGLDRDDDLVDAARTHLRRAGRDGVRLMVSAAEATGLPSGSFDLVHGRGVTIGSADPAAIITEMVRITRPGGYVALQDCYATGWTPCVPPHPAWTAIYDGLRQALPGSFDADPALSELLTGAGLADVQVAHNALETFPGGYGRDHLTYLAGRHRGPLLAAGAFTDSALDDAIAGLHEHVGDPGTRVPFPTLVQAWARKPLCDELSGPRPVAYHEGEWTHERPDDCRQRTASLR
jgi:SAM-dependent methyltransferase